MLKKSFTFKFLIKPLGMKVSFIQCRKLFSTNKINSEPLPLSKKNFDYMKNHQQTSFLQKGLMAIGSSLLALSRPTRGDMIAVLGETTGPFALERMRQRMMRSETGRYILEKKPQINSSTINFEELANLPLNTFGAHYLKYQTAFLIHCLFSKHFKLDETS